MISGDFKDLPIKTASDKKLCDKAFSIAKNPKYDAYQRFINFLIGSHKVVVLKMKICQTSNLLKNYTNQLLQNLKNGKYTQNIWGADLADLQLISKFNKGICFFLCVIGIYSKYAWVVSLKDKKGIIITNAF